MQTVLISFVVIALLMAMMAVGVIFGRKPLKGSCGGVANALNDPDFVCDLCGNDPAKCEDETDRAAKGAASHANFYDAG